MSPTPVIQALKLLHFQGILDHLEKGEIETAQVDLRNHLTAVRDAVLLSMESQTAENLDLKW